MRHYLSPFLFLGVAIAGTYYLAVTDEPEPMTFEEWSAPTDPPRHPHAADDPNPRV
jgi:hypothetical protein